MIDNLNQLYLVMRISSCFAIIIGIFIALFQLFLFRKQYKAAHEWNRRSTAFSYSFSGDPEMLQVLTRLDEHFKISSTTSCEISLDIINKTITNYPQARNDIHFSLARLEYMCTAIKQGVADESICRDLLENRTISFYRFFRQYIDDVRELRGSQKIMENLEYYANKWASKKVFPKRNPTGT